MSSHNIAIHSSGEDMAGEKVTLMESITVPVDKYPKYNFVGRILGPRGMTAKQLEEETGCKIMVRGRGSSRTTSKQSGNDSVPLHVVIQCEDYQPRAQQKLRNAVEAINQLLHPPPDGKDELKRKQLIELSIINGTYRPTKVASQHCRSTGSNLSENTEPIRIISSLIDSSMQNSLGLINPGPNPKRQNFNERQQSPQCWTSMAQLLSMIAPLHQTVLNPSFISEYYKNMLSLSMTDAKNIPTFLPNQPLDSYNNPVTMLPQHNTIQPANLQQYLQAAAMLNSVPFIHDGSGDYQKPKRH